MPQIVIGVIALLAVLSSTGRAAAPEPGDSCRDLLANLALTHMVHVNVVQVQEYPGQWAAASTQILIKLIEHFKIPALDFAYFEQLFRRDGVPLYLVANPLPLPLGLYAGYPGVMSQLKHGNKPKYHLWVGVKGKKEADEFKASLGVTDEENLANLRETGIIIQADPTRN